MVRWQSPPTRKQLDINHTPVCPVSTNTLKSDSDLRVETLFCFFLLKKEREKQRHNPSTRQYVKHTKINPGNSHAINT